MTDPAVPSYPCVEFRAITNGTRYAADGKKIFGPFDDERLFYPISSIEDLFHVNYCREYKDYAVVGYFNLDQLVSRAVEGRDKKMLEVRRIKKNLDNLISSPEMRQQLRDKDKLETEKAKAQLVAELSAPTVDAPVGVAEKTEEEDGAKRVRVKKESA